MDARDKTASVFRTAHTRHPLAVMPDHVLSPMDSHPTVGISRELIEACEQHGPTAKEPA